MGDEIDNFLGELNAVLVHFAHQDLLAGVVVGRCEAGRETPLKPGEQPLFHAFHVVGRAIGGQDDLLT